jgi:copper oxidase (laccase) domain-containing protein
LFHDPVTGAVGAAHAGWRGTAADIAGKTVKAMCDAYGCDPKNIHCAIGPNDPCPCGSGKKYKKGCMQKDKLN